MVNLGGGGMASENGAYEAGGMEEAGAKEALNRCQYTIPGVLHFVQHEWAKFEMQRAQWEMEKADLQAQVSFLKGERKGQENLKNDLVRRIKMLEFALKQERAKNYKLRHGTDPEPGEVQAEALEAEPGPADEAGGFQPGSAHSWHQGRQLLRQYLEEIGYSEKMLELRLTRAQSILGVSKPNDAAQVGRHAEEMVERALRERDSAVRAAGAFLGSGKGQEAQRGSDSDEEDEDGAAVLQRIKEIQAKTAPSPAAAAATPDGLSAAETEAMKEFDFIHAEPGAEGGAPTGPQGQNWDMTPEQMKRMTEAYRAEAKSKKSHSQDSLEKEGNFPFRPSNSDELKSAGLSGELEALGDVDPASTDDVDPGASDHAAQDEDAERRTWVCKYTLRSHLDGIRAMGFHPVEPLLLTASYDATLKMWNLQKGPGSPGGKKSQTSGQPDMEPVYTFRGHRGPILCLCLSPTGDTVYTGGLDASIRSWNLPSPNTEPYEPYDARLAGPVLEGHSDAVWSLAYHSGTENRLLSASADGTMKVWEPGAPAAEALVNTILPPAGAASGDVPVSVDFVSTEPKQAMVAYKTGPGAAEKSRAYIVELESGTAVMRLELGAEAALVHQILSHPTMPLAMVASADAYVRFFDATTGSCAEAIPAHTDAVTSLSVDPNGLFLLSGSHDGSLRLWNLESKSCLQEITAHRKKMDEAVLAVAFHPSRPIIASAGADSNAKLFV